MYKKFLEFGSRFDLNPYFDLKVIQNDGIEREKISNIYFLVRDSFLIPTYLEWCVSSFFITLVCFFYKFQIDQAFY